jgi:Rrf2 family protein
MLFSTFTGYGLQILAALPGDSGSLRIEELSEALALPGSELTEVLHTLVRAGFLEAPRGPGDGFRLARPACCITVGEVLETLEGPDALDGCLLGLPTCGPENPCPLHVLWSEVKAQMDVSLSQATIGELQRLSPGKRHLLAAATA